MSPTIVKSKQSQIEIFRQLHARMKRRFSRHQTGNANNLRGYKGSEDLASFGLDFWTGQKWVGIDLWGPRIDGSSDYGRALGFATYSPNSRIGLTAAALARDARGMSNTQDSAMRTPQRCPSFRQREDLLWFQCR